MALVMRNGVLEEVGFVDGVQRAGRRVTEGSQAPGDPARNNNREYCATPMQLSSMCPMGQNVDISFENGPCLLRSYMRV